MTTDLIAPVWCHPPTMRFVFVATPVELVERKLDAKFAADRIEHTNTFRYHFLADAVTGDDRYSV